MCQTLSWNMQQPEEFSAFYQNKDSQQQWNHRDSHQVRSRRNVPSSTPGYKNPALMHSLVHSNMSLRARAGNSRGEIKNQNWWKKTPSSLQKKVSHGHSGQSVTSPSAELLWSSVSLLSPGHLGVWPLALALYFCGSLLNLTLSVPAQPGLTKPGLTRSGLGLHS